MKLKFVSFRLFLIGIVHPAAYEYHTHHTDGAEQQESHEAYPHHETIADHSALLTTENFPSDKHTQVVFKSTTASPIHHEHEQQHEHELEQHEQHYLPPVTQIKTYKAPLVYSKFEQYYNTQYDDQSGQEHDHQEEGNSGNLLKIHENSIFN